MNGPDEKRIAEIRSVFNRGLFVDTPAISDLLAALDAARAHAAGAESRALASAVAHREARDERDAARAELAAATARAEQAERNIATGTADVTARTLALTLLNNIREALDEVDAPDASDGEAELVAMHEPVLGSVVYAPARIRELAYLLERERAGQEYIAKRAIAVERERQALSDTLTRTIVDRDAARAETEVFRRDLVRENELYTEARAELADRNRELDEIANALGIVYEADGHNPQRGPHDAILSHVRDGHAARAELARVTEERDRFLADRSGLETIYDARTDEAARFRAALEIFANDPADATIRLIARCALLDMHTDTAGADVDRAWAERQAARVNECQNAPVMSAESRAAIDAIEAAAVDRLREAHAVRPEQCPSTYEHSRCALPQGHAGWHQDARHSWPNVASQSAAPWWTQWTRCPEVAPPDTRCLFDGSPCAGEQCSSQAGHPGPVHLNARTGHRWLGRERRAAGELAPDTDPNSLPAGEKDSG